MRDFSNHLNRRSLLRFVFYGVCLLVLASLAVAALEPPPPGALEKYRKDGTLAQRQAFARELGNFKVSPYLIQRANQRLAALTGAEPEVLPTPPPGWRGMPTTGTVRILALLIGFSDYGPANTSTTINNNLFSDGSGTYPYESLRNFYRRSSFNQLEITGNTLGWYVTAYPRSSVVQSYVGRENLIKEALNYYEAMGHDFSQYDNDGDGYVDYLVVIWAGPDTGWGNFWWGYQTGWQDGSYSLDGVRFGTYSWQWESRPWPGSYSVRVVIHETGHALGLPDFYDYDDTVGPDGGVGGLDQMDGNWGDHNCWSKFLLDWFTPTVYNAGTHSVSLRAAANNADALLVMPGASSSEFGEFFMVQNRRRTGNDSTYPTDGLLIWHVDSRLDGTGNDYVYDNSWASHKLLRLMEADGLESIESYSAQADAGDFYVQGRSLTPSTTPSSGSYAGTPTNLSIDGISAAGDPMTFTATLPGGGCTLDCTASAPGSAQPGVPASFSATATPSGCSGSPTFLWNFGDGATSTSQNPTHAYASAGTYGWSMTASVSGTSCPRSGSIVVGGSGHSVYLTWSAPASGGVNPPLNLQGTASAADPEATVTEAEPNGCITLVGGTDNVQTLYAGDTLNGTVDTYDYGGCIYWSGTTDLWEDLYGVQINSSGTYTFTLTYSSGPDLDLILVSLPNTVLNPACGSATCGITCSNPETFSVSLSPGLYLLCVNLASEGACTPAAYASYALSVSGGSSGPVLQGYNVYRATVDSSSSYSQINGGPIPSGSTSFTDGNPPTGTVYYRARAVFDSGTSDWSNTATVVVGGGGCSLSCSASVPSTAETGDTVSFLSSATPSGCSGGPTYAWSFGDGVTSTLQNPTHTYTAANTYTWQLTVSVGGGTPCSRTGSIVVTSSVTPPAVYSMQKLGNPFRISVSGSNFQSGIRVFIGGTEWWNFVVKSSGSIVLKGGSALKSLVPKYSTREFVFRNADGGECRVTWGWP